MCSQDKEAPRGPQTVCSDAGGLHYTTVVRL